MVKSVSLSDLGDFGVMAAGRATRGCAAVAERGKRAMPTVLRVGRFRFSFFSNESQEPPHVHVKAAENECKFWLDPVNLAFNYGFHGRELREIEKLVRQHQIDLLESWNEYFA